MMLFRCFVFGLHIEKNIIAVRGKAPKVRQTTDGGELRLRLTEGKNPRNKRINKTKP